MAQLSQFLKACLLDNTLDNTGPPQDRRHLGRCPVPAPHGQLIPPRGAGCDCHHTGWINSGLPKGVYADLVLYARATLCFTVAAGAKPSHACRKSSSHRQKKDTAMVSIVGAPSGSGSATGAIDFA